MTTIRSAMFQPSRASANGRVGVIVLDDILLILLGTLISALVPRVIDWIGKALAPKPNETPEQISAARAYTSAPISATEDLALARKRAGLDAPGTKPNDAETADFFAKTGEFFAEHADEIAAFLLELFGKDDVSKVEGATGTPIGDDYTLVNGGGSYTSAKDSSQ